MATHSSILAWKIPRTGEPGGLQCIGSQRVRHNWSKLAHCCSITKLCPALWDPMNGSMTGLPVLHYLPEFAQTHVHWVSDANQPSQPLSSPFLLPSIFPSIRVFSNESVLHIRWPAYWNCSFSISPSNEYSELISSQSSLVASYGL